MSMNNTRRAFLVAMVVLMGSWGAGLSWGQFLGQRALSTDEVATLRDRAIAEVRAAAVADDAALRMNAIEASHPVPGLASELVEPMLLDEVVPVRFAALMTVGQLKLEEHGQAAADLSLDENLSVRAAAIFAADANGVAIDVSPLAQLVHSPEPGVRGNAALILGEMGDASAKEMLHEAARVPFDRRIMAIRREIVQVQVAEALVKLGDLEALTPIRAAAYSQSDEIRVLAVSMLGPLGDRRMIPMLARMLEQPPVELQLAAARSLMQLGVEDGMPILVRGLDSAMPTVRAQAAFSLGDSGDPIGLALLGDTLEDEVPMVRLAAAAAVLKRLPTAGEAQSARR
ncbi:MAG: HEAT repeat domain-containing protein [Phycisphaeraceae bacterium]